MAAFIVIIGMIGTALLIMALIAGFFEEIAARQAIIKEAERKRAEAAERAERIRRKRAREIAEIRRTGHRAWGGYVGGHYIK